VIGGSLGLFETDSRAGAAAQAQLATGAARGVVAGGAVRCCRRAGSAWRATALIAAPDDLGHARHAATGHSQARDQLRFPVWFACSPATLLERLRQPAAKH
jgi:hypothetical protein